MTSSSHAAANTRSVRADESETSETEGLDGVAGVDPRLRISVKKWDAIVVVRFFKATAVVDASALRPASRWSQPIDAAAIARVLGERFAPAETLPKAIPDQYLVPLRTAEEPPKPSVVSAPVAAQALEPANASPVPQTTTPAKTIAVSETAFDSTLSDCRSVLTSSTPMPQPRGPNSCAAIPR